MAGRRSTRAIFNPIGGGEGGGRREKSKERNTIEQHANDRLIDFVRLTLNP